MTSVSLFISCVSKEFLSYREALRKALERPNVNVKIQDDFIVSGLPTLDKLDRYIRACDGVIHLVGDMTGAMAKPASVDTIAKLCPDIVERLPEIAGAFDSSGLQLSYTQWEAYLALYHKKDLVIARPAADAKREDVTYIFEPAQTAKQEAHLLRLQPHERFAPIVFLDDRDLALGIYRSTLYDLLVKAGIADAQVLLPNSDDITGQRHREILEQIARQKGVDPESLRPVLENLDLDPNLSPLDVPRLLNERIDAIRAAAATPFVPSNEGGDIDLVRKRSRDALKDAKTEEAIVILDRQIAVERAVLEERKRRAVTLLQDRAVVERLRYDYTAARATLQEVLRLDPDQARSWISLGDDWVTVGALGEATRAYDAALDAAKRNGDERGLAVSYAKIGDVQAAQGALGDALTSYLDGLAICERLTEADPGNAEWQRDLSISYSKIGNVQVAHDALDDALTSYRDGLAICERLAKTDPSNAQLKRDLSVSHNKVGDVQVSQGALGDALNSYRDGLAICERLAKTDPGNAEWQRDLSVSYEKIGDVQVAQGALGDALISYRDSLAICERLTKADPGNAQLKRDLSVSHNKIGNVQGAQGAIDDALTSYRAGLAVCERLAKIDPGNVQWQTDLIAISAKLALAGDDPLNRWRYVVTALRKLKEEKRLTAQQRDVWLPYAEASLAELERN